MLWLPLVLAVLVALVVRVKDYLDRSLRLVLFGKKYRVLPSVV